MMRRIFPCIHQLSDWPHFTWLTWFLQCLDRALTRAEQTLAQVLAKGRFWEQHRGTPLTERQHRLVSNCLTASRAS